MKKIAALLALLLALAPHPARADIGALVQAGNLTATGQITVVGLTGQSTCATTVSGGATASLVFEGAADAPPNGSTFIALPTVINRGAPAVQPVSASVNATYITDVPAMVAFRARVSAYTSGTITLTVNCAGSQTGALVGGAINSSGATLPVACDKTAAVNISTATTTAVVAVSGSQSVYVCAYHLYVVSGTTPGFQFEYGAGAACATSPVVLSGVFGGIAGAVGTNFNLGASNGALFSTPAAQGFCIVSSGTTPNVQGFVTYAQF